MQSVRTLIGRCECRAVAYEVDDAFEYAANCHCSNCRASTGSAFKPFAGIARDRLSVTQGAGNLMIVGEADNNHTRCATCGALLFSVVQDGARVHVALGSLVDVPTLLPTRHMFVGSKAPWHDATSLPQAAARSRRDDARSRSARPSGLTTRLATPFRRRRGGFCRRSASTSSWHCAWRLASLERVTEPESRPVLRAGDAEREHAVATLRRAVVEGRLTLEEFGDRVGAAYEARTEPELGRLVEDLPARTAAAGMPVEQKALFSHLVRNGPLRLPARTAFRSIFGTIDLDLRQATLEAPEVDIAVHNVFGTVTVLVPEGTDVQVEGGTGLFASLRLDTTTSVPTAGGPVVRIRASGIGGTLNVRTREPKRLVQRLLGSASS